MFIFYQGATYVLVKFSQKGPYKKFYVVNLGFWPTWDFKIITKIFTGPQRKVPQVAYASYIFLAKFSKRPAVPGMGGLDGGARKLKAMTRGCCIL